MMFKLRSLIGFLALSVGVSGAKNIVEVAQATANLSTLVTAVTKADLVTTLTGTGPFTVFAPTNAAFAALPKGTLDNLLKPASKHSLVAVLTYHVVASKALAATLTNNQKIKTVQTQEVMVKIASGTVSINDAKVTTADVAASNGVVHIIDKVLLPKNIVELAQATADLSTLVTAVTSADLVTTLTGTGPFTVFAPTNAAFAALPKGTLDNLLKPANKAELVKVLTYHVVPSKALAASLKNNQKIKTVQTQDVTVKITGGNVMINDAKVTTADVAAANGVVHIIDKVLLPKAAQTTQAAANLSKGKANNSTEKSSLSSDASTTGIACAVVVALGLRAIQ